MKRLPFVRSAIGWVMMPLPQILHTTGQQITINCYSGCPSSGELSSIWSFFSQPASTGESTCEQELDLTSISGNIESTSWGPTENTIYQNNAGVAEVNRHHNVDKGNGLGGTSIPKIRSVAQLLDQPAGSTDTSLLKVNDEL
ncbi:hypothetical protein V6N13_106828 [Hibiscus sabdariffa]|uniref:Uncharacterized protein n=1 Tax=Hibiscus sabdariffa TaxID=183260 RepID=A0ABR2F1Z6_9ROSI